MSESTILLILSTLFALGGGAIGYLIADNRTLKETSRSLRGLALGMIMKVLEHDSSKIDPELRRFAQRSSEELKKTF